VGVTRAFSVGIAFVVVWANRPFAAMINVAIPANLRDPWRACIVHPFEYLGYNISKAKLDFKELIDGDVLTMVIREVKPAVAMRRILWNQRVGGRSPFVILDLPINRSLF
ncbi:MAG: hypothetical protein V3U73_13890, partial [bacterium]